jgi:outer membrane protein TolC
MDPRTGKSPQVKLRALAALAASVGLATAVFSGDGISAPSNGRAAPKSGSVTVRDRQPEKSRAAPKIRTVSADEPAPAPTDPDAIPDDRGTSIDLSTALRLAGVENLELIQARQRVEAAVAVQQLAAAQILPTISLGTNFDSHTGNLQQANGNILNVQRSALYVGAGANAVAAGTVPIPGLQWNLNVSESIYNYFVTQQRTEQARLTSAAERNAVLLRVALAYTDLLAANARLSLAILTRNDAREVARLTAEYAETGEGRPADANRAATELRRREENAAEARYAVGQASRRLSELLNLDVTILLRPLEARVVPQSIVPNRVPLAELIAVAMLDRPELQARQAAIRAAMLELDSAKMLPFSPQVMIGFSNGVFGGGSNLVASPTPPVVGLPPNQPRFGDFKDRADIDAIAYWSARNLGLGNKALIDVARSRVSSADSEERATLDRVRFEVAEAFVRTHIRFREIETRARGVRSGADALVEDLNRVRAGEALPIEVLDSLRRLASERGDYLDAIADYNKGQFELYVALGSPPADVLARPVPQDLQQAPSD